VPATVLGVAGTEITVFDVYLACTRVSAGLDATSMLGNGTRKRTLHCGPPEPALQLINEVTQARTPTAPKGGRGGGSSDRTESHPERQCEPDPVGHLEREQRERESMAGPTARPHPGTESHLCGTHGGESGDEWRRGGIPMDSNGPSP